MNNNTKVTSNPAGVIHSIFLINFVLNSLKEIEDAERNWDKTDTLDLM